MNEMHVELIEPNERLDQSLGGTGYLPPRVSERASVEELVADLRLRATQEFNFGMSIWKVGRYSTPSWRRWAKSRRLVVHGKRIACEVVGSTRDWWFVAVKCAPAIKALSAVAPPVDEKAPQE